MFKVGAVVVNGGVEYKIMEIAENYPGEFKVKVCNHKTGACIYSWLPAHAFSEMKNGRIIVR